jgi:hypothetical protein
METFSLFQKVMVVFCIFLFKKKYSPKKDKVKIMRNYIIMTRVMMYWQMALFQ